MTAVQITRCQLFNWRSEKFHFRKSAFVFVEAVFCCFFLTFFIDLFKSVCIEDRNSGKKLRELRRYDQMVEDSGKGFFFSDFSYTQLTSRQRLVRIGEII